MTTTTDTTNDRLAALHARRASRQGEAINTGAQEQVSSPLPKPNLREALPAELPVWALKMRADYESQIKQLKEQIKEYEMSIVQQSNAQKQLVSQQQALTLHGGEANVVAMKKQLALSPKFADLTADEHEYIARLALGMGLNPEFHFHAWKSTKSVKNGNKWEKVEVLNVTPDYKALLFKAKSERRVTIKERMLTPEEMKARGISEQDISEGSICYVVELTDIADAILCKQGEIEYEPLRGYGFWAAKKEEKSNYDEATKTYKTIKRSPNDVANGRDGAWMAWKRAVRALYYQIADMSLSYMPSPTSKVNATDDDIYQYDPASSMVVEGEFSESKAEEEKPARWQEEEGRIEKAAQWMVSQGVTDALFTESTGTDWRTSDISAEEFKFVVESLAKPQPAAEIIEGEIVTDTAAEPAAPEQTADPQVSTKCSVSDCENPAERNGMCTMHAAADGAKCANCQIENATDNPVDNTLCNTCANRKADKQAAAKK